MKQTIFYLKTIYDDEDCMEDYYAVEVFDEHDNVIAKFGDYYHDKGDIRAEAFIQGYCYGKNIKKYEISREQKYIEMDEYYDN